jgi:hypothetical protein
MGYAQLTFSALDTLGLAPPWQVKITAGSLAVPLAIALIDVIRGIKTKLLKGAIADA